MEFPLQEGTGEEPRNHPLMLFHLLEMAILRDLHHWSVEEPKANNPIAKKVAKKLNEQLEELKAMRNEYRKTVF
jgi:hypothetical protein